MLDSPFFKVLGVLMLLFGIASFGYYARRAITSDSIGRVHFSQNVLASLYPIGVGFKALMFGPEFLRFHLSDIGFPIYIAFILEGMYSKGMQKNTYYLGLDLAGRMRMEISARKRMIRWALALSYGYEVMVGLMYRARPDMKVQVIGGFDWGDMIMYTVGAAVAYLLVSLYSKRNAQYKEELAAREAQELAEQKAARSTVAARRRKARAAANRKGGRR